MSIFLVFFFFFVQRVVFFFFCASIDQRPKAHDKSLTAAATSAMLPEGFDFSPPPPETGYLGIRDLLISGHPAFPPYTFSTSVCIF